MDKLYSVSEIDGVLFGSMLENGLANLRAGEERVNDMNVFPVPDGDTGTNLRLTVSSGLKNAGKCGNLSEYLCKVSQGMLFGARGNSGVIVSRIFSGMASALDGKSVMKPDDFINALIRGYKAAYASLSNPVEGTVLTVAREGTEYFSKYGFDLSSFGKLFDVYLEGMYRSLEKTPLLLPKLKEAGVTDSGAYGFILIVEGMAKYLSGEIIDSSLPEEKQDVDFSAFTEKSSFDFGYCMEFLLRLMSSRTDMNSFDENVFATELGRLGDSLVCVRDGSIVKIHIHVFRPAPVIDLAQKYGEFLTFKLENMSLQHNETIVTSGVPEAEHVPLAVVAGVNGSGFAKLLSSFPFVHVISGKSEISAEEFINACKEVNADRIVIMANAKNAINSAIQAVSLMGDSSITTIPTDSAAQCYYALAMDDGGNTEERMKSMEENAKALRSIFIAKATKTVEIDTVRCIEGMYVAYTDGRAVCCEKDLADCAAKAVKQYSSCSVCFVFKGKNCADTDFENKFRNFLPDTEVSVSEGFQDRYELILGVAE